MRAQRGAPQRPERRRNVFVLAFLFLEDDMREKRKTIWTRAAPARKLLVLYIEDLLLLASGICFTLAAAEYAGRPAALATAGVWFAVYAVVIARAKRGGGGK